MLKFLPKELDQYCLDHTTSGSPLLARLEKETYDTMENPQMVIGRIQGTFLKLLVKMTRAERVLEIGTFTGYSALMMAEGLPEHGHLITCDIDPEATAVARRYWTQSPHGKKIELKLGNALQTVCDLEGSFDVVFIDADKENYIHYWEACIPKVRSGGVIAVDNVLWSGRVLRPVEVTDQALAAFNEHVKNDKRVDAVMLPLRDGVTLACRNQDR